MGICAIPQKRRTSIAALAACLACSVAGAMAQVDAQRAFGQGMEAYANAQYAEASERFAECRQAAPEVPDYGVWEALALIRLGAYREALPVLNAVIQIAPGNASAHANLGLVWHRLGSTDAAIAALRTAVGLAPDQDATRANLAALLMAQGRLDEAEALWRERLDTGPATAAAHRGLAAVLERRGQYDAALAEASAALAASPEDPDAVALAARLHVRTGDARSGMALMASVASPTLAQVEAFAAALLATDATMDAVAHLERPGIMGRLSASGLATLAEGLRREQRWDELQGVLERLVAHDDFARRWWPKDRAPAMATLGWLAMRAGDASAAGVWAQQALALDPEQPLARRVAGGGTGRSAALVATEGELTGGSEDLHTARYFLHEALSMADYRPAPEVLRVLAGWLPEDGRLLLVLGLLALRIGERDQAAGLLERASRVAADDAIVWNNLGVAYELAGRAEDAAGAYSMALRLNPDLAEAGMNLDRLRGGTDG